MKQTFFIFFLCLSTINNSTSGMEQSDLEIGIIASKTLDIELNTSKTEIEAAYQTLRAQYLAQKKSGNEEAGKKLLEIARARRFLLEFQKCNGPLCNNLTKTRLANPCCKEISLCDKCITSCSYFGCPDCNKDIIIVRENSNFRLECAFKCNGLECNNKGRKYISTCCSKGFDGLGLCDGCLINKRKIQCPSCNKDCSIDHCNITNIITLYTNNQIRETKKNEIALPNNKTSDLLENNKIHKPQSHISEKSTTSGGMPNPDNGTFTTVLHSVRANSLLTLVGVTTVVGLCYWAYNAYNTPQEQTEDEEKEE